MVIHAQALYTVTHKVQRINDMLIEPLLTRYLRRTNQRYMRFHDELNITPFQPRSRDYLLYIHIPFCEVLCPFCSFHRVQFKQDKAMSYFQALKRQIRDYAQRGFDFSSVYVGGGTPTVVPRELVEILDLVRSLFSVKRISIETNPDHLSDEVMTMMKAAGVNRLSVGIQTIDDRLLKEMERYDKYGCGAQIVERLQDAQGRFDTLNADMIFNIPHQTRASLERDIQAISETAKVDQVSFYPLMESSTTQLSMSNKMGNMDYRREKKYYSIIVDGMGRDYQRSTAWCFSRTDTMIDEYIIDDDEYIGVGSGAFSYIDGVTYSTTFSINRYIALISQGKAPITAKREFSTYETMRYALLMRFFGLSLDKASMNSRFDNRFFQTLWKEFLAMELTGAIEDHGDHYRLTEKGTYYWVVMMREFFIGVNNFRDQMRHRIKEER